MEHLAKLITLQVEETSKYDAFDDFGDKERMPVRTECTDASIFTLGPDNTASGKFDLDMYHETILSDQSEGRGAVQVPKKPSCC